MLGNPSPEQTGCESPLTNQDVTIQSGELVVTNVVINGFYITDVADDSYNSLFVFNFNYPEGLRVGHRLCHVSGGVQEHVGMTQLVFPSWQVHGMPPTADAEEGGLPIYCFAEDLPPATIVPTELTSSDLDDWDLLESLESGVVTIDDLELSNRFIDCDYNTSGEIERGTDEALCRDDCQDDPLCTELSSYRSYGQWKASADGSMVYAVAVDQVAEFDILEGCWQAPPPEDNPTTIYECPNRRVSFMTGNLKHIALTRTIQFWVIEPRFKSDFGIVTYE